MYKMNCELECRMIAQGIHGEIMAYISEHGLEKRAQVLLIERGNHEEIMAYVAEESLSDDAEVALIKRGNHDEIMAYLRTHPLWEEPTTALLKRGNHEEIMAHINGYNEGRIANPFVACLSCEAIEILYERGDREEIEAYENR